MKVQLKPGVSRRVFAILLSGVIAVSGSWVPIISFVFPGLCLPSGQLRAESPEEFFETKIRPLLVRRCLGCHSAEKGHTKGGLALDSAGGWQVGGESGPAIVPGNPDESILIRAIRYSNDGAQMPPEEADGKLPDAEIALLEQWVRMGAPDPRTTKVLTGAMTVQQAADWWAFRPLLPVSVPVVQAESVPAESESGQDSVRNDVDRFLQAQLQNAGLKSSAEADRRTLIRRATYDLTGLPPTAEEVAKFVRDDSPSAYEDLVTRLLSSRHYGERWGRHWLDLVRYADTAGENTDHPIQDAWRYRNWVIDSFNRDLPYDQFVREQIAGDLLHRNDSAEQYAAGVVATGFLAIARRFDHDSDKHMHLTFEDTIDTMGKAFLGLSIACARCHDHKYDPVSAKDYYALYGILNSTRFAFPGCEAKQQPRDLVPLLSPAEWARTVEPYESKMAGIDNALKSVQDQQAALSGELKLLAMPASTTLAAGTIADGGQQSFAEGSGGSISPVLIRQGQMIQLIIDPQENYGADTTIVEWQLTEQGGQERQWNLSRDVVTSFLSGNPHSDRLGNDGVWWFLDRRGGTGVLLEPVASLSSQATLSAWRNGDNPSVFVNSSESPVSVWTTLPAQTVFVHPAADGPVAIGWVSPIDGEVRIEGRIADGHPGGPNGVGFRLELQPGDQTKIFKELMRLGQIRSRMMADRNELLSQTPLREFAYAVTEGEVGNTRMHMRGDPEKPGDEVPRRWLEVFGGHPVSADQGSGRLQLAEWLTDSQNPLPARVMVNRLWQHHFGRGLVPTPNDFGTRGERPSHPELLDWLAAEFVRSGWSIKAMHRLMMHSAAYRQSSDPADLALRSRAEETDPNNTLLWRFDRRRLSAEELRDSLLIAGGQIDLSTGGPHPIPSPATWQFSQHVPFAGLPESSLRSVYLLTLRNRRHAFLGLFDGADPNTTTPQRQLTIVPAQSLYFMNDPFFHEQAAMLASRLQTAADNEARVRLLFRIVLQRDPVEREQTAAVSFLNHYTAQLSGERSSVNSREAEDAGESVESAAWQAYARILLSSNEFLFVD